MDKLTFWLGLVQAAIPLAIALVTTIATVSNNRKKTGDKLDELKKELKEEIKASNDDIDDVKKTLAAHIKEDEESKTRQARIRILRFYDEICEGKRHSENHFEDIIEDIDDYESFCDSHPDFKNNRGQTACEYIKEIYKKIKAENGFLTHT